MNRKKKLLESLGFEAIHFAFVSNELLGNYEVLEKLILLRGLYMNKLSVISEKEKTQFAWKKFFMFALIFACAVTPIFAQDATTGIDGAVSKVTTFLSSGAITAVCLIALVVEAIGVVVMGKQGADIQSIISKFAPWVVGTVVLLSANGICNYFLSDLSFGD